MVSCHINDWYWVLYPENQILFLVPVLVCRMYHSYASLVCPLNHSTSLVRRNKFCELFGLGGDLRTPIFDWDTPNSVLNSCTVNINCFNCLYIECPNQFFECANQFPFGFDTRNKFVLLPFIFGYTPLNNTSDAYITTPLCII